MSDFDTNDEFARMLEKLYEEKYLEIYRMAYERLGDAFAAEDVVEEVFITIMGHQVWWAKQNENVRLEYVMRTCESLCCKIIEDREKVRFIEYEEKTPENEDGIMELSVEQGIEVSEYLDELNDLDRKLFGERYYENHSVKEIAHMNNMTENNVSKRLARGRNKMHEFAKKTDKNDRKRKGTKP